MKSILKLASIAGSAALLLTGCGNFELGKNAKLVVDPAKQSARFELEMGDGTEVSLNGEFPIANDKGKLIFVPATKTENAKIVLEADLAAFTGNFIDGLESVTTLPNGAPLPAAMTPPLLGINVMNSKSYQASALFSLKPELQLGAAISIAQMSSKYFPGGVALCQNFRNAQKVAFAAICAYGPSATKNGGIFLGANFGQVIKSTDTALSTDLSASATFAVPSNQLTLRAMNLSSSDNQISMHDPKNDLAGKKGEKAGRNLQKILQKKN